MSRHSQEIPTDRGVYTLVSGVDPPTHLMFVQLYGPGTAEDEVPGGPGEDENGQWLLIDADVETVDELEAVMRQQEYLKLEEAFAAFGTPWPEDEAQQRWYNDHGRMLLDAELRSIAGEVKATERDDQIGVIARELKAEIDADG